MNTKARLNPFLIQEIVARREKGMAAKDIMEELNLHPKRYSKWKKQALDLLEAHENGKVPKLTKHHVNLINFFYKTMQAEERYSISVLEEFNEERYKGMSEAERLSLAKKKVLESYEEDY